VRRLAACLLVAVLTLAACGDTSSPDSAPSSSSPPVTTGPPTAPVSVYFLKGEQFNPVTRSVPHGEEAPQGALEELFAGPTSEEKAQGIDTALPEGVKLDSVVVADGTATVTVSHAQTTPTPMDVSLRPARASQIVYTLTAIPGITKVVINVNGESRATFEGDTLALHESLDRAALSQPMTLPPEPAQVPSGAAPADPAGVQKRLVELKYLPTAGVTGKWDYATQQAVLAFQGWEGVDRDGVVGPQTLAELETASAPKPQTTGSGHRIEVYTGKGVTLLVDGSTLVRALHSVSGAAGYETPPGAFQVFRKEEQSWSVPYQVWMPWASYFNGGIALHESADMPAYPASHGCVRLPNPDAQFAYEFAPVGTPVQVY
jgi:lipoprotein-anchoring transpeptidase ErfK/SrfK